MARLYKKGLVIYNKLVYTQNLTGNHGQRAEHKSCNYWRSILGHNDHHLNVTSLGQNSQSMQTKTGNW
jgi:hypothetical protein